MTQQMETSKDIEIAADYLRRPYARIILPEADGSFRGEIMEFPGCIATGETAAETLLGLEDVARGWLEAALERGQNIPQPFDNNNEFSGKLVLRLPKSLHKKAAWIAEREGVSLNQLIVSSLAENVGEKYGTANNVITASFHNQFSTYVYLSGSTFYQHVPAGNLVSGSPGAATVSNITGISGTTTGIGTAMQSLTYAKDFHVGATNAGD